MKATFKAILNGVLNRLAKFTSITEYNAKMSVNELYTDHTNSLALTRINKKTFQNMKELWENADEQEKNKQ